jgi:hypothetical protein
MHYHGEFISTKYNILNFPLIEGTFKLEIKKNKAYIKIYNTGCYFTNKKYTITLHKQDTKNYKCGSYNYTFPKKSRHCLFVGKDKEDNVIGIFFTASQLKDKGTINGYYKSFDCNGNEDYGEIYFDLKC